MSTKITIITAFFPPERGAASYRILNTAKELKSFGFDVDVITTLANYPTGKLFKGYRWRLFKNEIVQGIPCKRYWLFPSNSNNPVIRVFSMTSYCISLLFTSPVLLLSKPDIVLVQSPPLLAALTASAIAKFIGAKVVLNVSDIWPLTASELGVMRHDSLAFKSFSLVENLMYRLSDAFIGQSNETLIYLEGKTNKPLYLYRNLTKPNYNKRNNVNFNANKKIVYAGLLGLAQNVFNICKSIDFENLNIEFHIYGDGIEKSLIENYINANPRCNIFLHKTVSKEEIQVKLISFDATIIPLITNIYGAFPSKISMAMACALPIFFSGDGEGYEFVKKFNLGYVSKAGDLDSLEKNIRNFSILDNVQLDLLKRDIMKTVNINFNYDHQQIGLNHFLKSIKNNEK